MVLVVILEPSVASAPPSSTGGGIPGDDFDPLILVRHKSVLEDSLKPLGYAGCPVEMGASSAGISETKASLIDKFIYEYYPFEGQLGYNLSQKANALSALGLKWRRHLMSNPDYQRPSVLSHLFSVSLLLFGLANALFGSIPWLSLIKKLFDLNLHGLPLKIVSEYQRLRDIALGPVINFFRDCDVVVPAWLIDGIIIYIVIAVAISRADKIVRDIDVQRYKNDPKGMEIEIKEAAEAAGRDPVYVFNKFLQSRQNTLKGKIYGAYRGWRNGIRWPIAIPINIKQLVRGPSGARYVATILLTVWVVAIAFALVGCGGYLLLSLLSSD